MTSMVFVEHRQFPLHASLEDVEESSFEEKSSEPSEISCIMSDSDEESTLNFSIN